MCCRWPIMQPLPCCTTSCPRCQMWWSGLSWWVGKHIFPARIECVCSDWHQAVLMQLEFPQFKQAGDCDSLCVPPGQGWRAHSHFPGVVGVGKLSCERLFYPSSQYWPDCSCLQSSGSSLMTGGKAPSAKLFPMAQPFGCSCCASSGCTKSTPLEFPW